MEHSNVESLLFVIVMFLIFGVGFVGVGLWHTAYNLQKEILKEIQLLKQIGRDASEQRGFWGKTINDTLIGVREDIRAGPDVSTKWNVDDDR